jgi:hypothetical protein
VLSVVNPRLFLAANAARGYFLHAAR